MGHVAIIWFSVAFKVAKMRGKLIKVKGIHSSSVDFKEFFNILCCGKEKEIISHITFEAIIAEAMIEGSVNVSMPLYINYNRIS